MMFDPDRAADALEDLLDHERRLILDGRIDGLARTSQQKDHLIARLSGSDAGPAMARLRGKAERNQALLEAAARGLKAAQRRIGQIAGAEPLRTYGADGAARDLQRGPHVSGVNRRA